MIAAFRNEVITAKVCAGMGVWSNNQRMPMRHAPRRHAVNTLPVEA